MNLKNIKINNIIEIVKNIKHKDLILGIYFFLLSGIISICKGMDRSFDVRNYHIYNPYAFLNNRYDIDIMPADIQSYFNPLLDVPYFLMIKYWNNFPYVATFLQGTSYALLLFLIYKTAKLVFKGINKNLLVFLSVLVGGTAALTLYNIGTLTHDIFVGDMILISIYYLLKSFDKFEWKNIIISSFVLGCVSGLKLTAGIFGVAIVLTLLCFYKTFNKPIKVFIIFVLFAFLGFIFTNGFWMYKMWVLYGNPVVPYFNNIFHSDFINCPNMLKEDFKNLYPRSVLEYIFYPFHFYQHLPVRAFELNYQDFRFSAIYVVLVLNLFISKFINNKIFENKYSINFAKINFLFVICVFTYIIWINTFSNVRYLTPIAALAGIIVLASVVKFYNFFEQRPEIFINLFDFIKNKCEKFDFYNVTKFFKKEYLLSLLLLWVGLYLTFTTIEPSMLKRIPIKQKIVYVDDMNIPDDAVVITVSGSAILIPFQNPDAKYYYLNASRFTERNIQILSSDIQDKIKIATKNYPDKTYIMLDLAIYRKNFETMKLTLKKYYDINFDDVECKTIITNIENKKSRSFYALCKAEIK